MEKKISPATIGNLPEYRLNALYSEKGLIPHEAVDRRYWSVFCKNENDWKIWRNATFRTKDNRRVHISFVSFYDNSDARYSADLDAICRKRYNMSFGYFRSVWASRYEGMLSDSWHYITMEEV